jgi:hypothetical protein
MLLHWHAHSVASLAFTHDGTVTMTTDLSRIRFSDHDTMVPNRGWKGCFHTFTAFCLLQPRLGTIVSWSLKRIRERSIGSLFNN